ncbi:hypothetical protein TNCV_2293361 [Trichonephila clavipes]|nr:hypothetical protein TNCV_2293361 [Trichonephila clavipes]
MKVRAVRRRQPLRVVVVEGIVIERMATIQSRYHTFHKQKVNPFPPFLLGADRHWNCHVECSATLQRQRGKTSDMFYRGVVYPSPNSGH